MWNLHTQKVERQFERKSTLDSFYVFSGEFVVGGDGMGVSVWDRETGLVLKQLPAHTKSLHGIAINPQNLLNFVSYSTDGSFVVWSMNPQHKKPSLFSRLLKKPPN
jgi:WD40 repeat protein